MELPVGMRGYYAAQQMDRQNQAADLQRAGTLSALYENMRQMGERQAVRDAVVMGPDKQLNAPATIANMYRVNPTLGVQFQAALKKEEETFGNDPKFALDPSTKQPYAYVVGNKGTVRRLEGVAPRDKMETIEQAGPDGRPVTAFYNPYAPPAEPVAKPVKPEQVNLGNRIDYVDPYAINKPLRLGVSPNTVYSENRADARGRNQVVTGGDGTVSLVDLKSGTSRPVMDASGQPMQAKAPLTEVQAKATSFSMRMTDADKVIEKMEADKAFDPAAIRTQWAGQSGMAAPLNYLASSKAQQYEQAKRNWVTANLRLESGAAIPEDELQQEYRKWFPIPGDSPEVVKQKSDSRKIAEQAMRVQAGPGARQLPAQEVVQSLPDPAKNNGRRYQADDGTVYRSDGTKWVREVR